MLTREALRQCLDSAAQEHGAAPPDGMLAHLIAAEKRNLTAAARTLGEEWNGTFNEGSVAVIAIAYAQAISKNGGPG